jgi:hypothetical protein
MKKKGDISINIIIIAVTSLLVLVVLLMIFSGKMNEWLHGVQEVEDQRCSDITGSTIKIATEPCDPGQKALLAGAFKDVEQGYKCCIPETVNQ